MKKEPRQPSPMSTRLTPASGRFLLAVASSVMVVSALLLFARLGHYALWDDEAAVVLSARAVWQTGDTGTSRVTILSPFGKAIWIAISRTAATRRCRPG
jgi:4-amino-4-deoxy-L-arabinose transferase-like glycosyltransferase